MKQQKQEKPEMVSAEIIRKNMLWNVIGSVGFIGAQWMMTILIVRLAGFTENDTLRSNQIREGMLTREKALEYVYRDNVPRYESMKWYFDVVGLDMNQVMERVSSLTPIYKR